MRKRIRETPKRLKQSLFIVTLLFVVSCVSAQSETIDRYSVGDGKKKLYLIVPSRVQSGMIEITFRYKEQSHLNLILRKSEMNDSDSWFTIEYQENRWKFLPPGDELIQELSQPTLIKGTTYRLFVSYAGQNVASYLNNQPFYQHEHITNTNMSKYNEEMSWRLYENHLTLTNAKNIAEFYIMRQHWKHNAVGDFYIQPELQRNVYVATYVAHLSQQSTWLYETINDTNAYRTTLWSKIPSDTKSAHITTQFRKLHNLARGYGTKGTALYKNAELLKTIVSGLDFMTKKGLYTGTKYYGNWWDWQIGVPHKLISILLIIFYDVDFKQIEKYTGIIEKYLPNPYQQMKGQSDQAVDLDFTGSLSTLQNLLIISKTANNKTTHVLRQAVKYWLVHNIDYYLQFSRDFKDLLMLTELLADTIIDSTIKPFLGSRVYGAMDRFVFSDSCITLGISMHSSRISAFQPMNQENKKGWHTGDGMVYLYNNDHQQFGDSYWPTVDWYRLPGTTVDTRKMVDATIYQSYRSPESFVGGVTDKTDAVVAMQLNKTGTLDTRQTSKNLVAKKSWFVFNRKIISLGSDIKGKTSSSIETVIENRLLDSSLSYQLVDQDGKKAHTIAAKKLCAFDWFLLKSSKQDLNIGYLMLDDQIISTRIESRNGTYETINEASTSDTVYTGIYQKIIVEHGKKVFNGKYAYLTYPAATETSLKALKEDQRFSIIQNTKDIQAVKDHQTNKLGAIIWNDAGGAVCGLSVNKPAILLYSYNENANHLVILSVSNPKQTDERVVIRLPCKVTKVISKDNGVQMTDDHTVVVNTVGSFGKTFQLTAKVTPNTTNGANDLCPKYLSNSFVLILALLLCLNFYIFFYIV